MENVKEAMFYPDIIEIGGSLGLIVRKDIVELINLKKADKVKIVIEVITRNNNKNGD